jgi:hypothetical protein
MKVFLKIDSDNFSDKGRVPRSFVGDIMGSEVLTIKTKWKGDGKCFQFDLKHVHFDDDRLLVEGIIGDDQGIIGRCVFSLRNECSVGDLQMEQYEEFLKDADWGHQPS